MPRSSGGLMVHMTRREELADFLRSRRESLRPEQVGLTPGGRRRTPGLRREEVAQLSGVSVTWYTWLEQARDITASPQVLGSLAATLRLTAAERAHLFVLAGSSPPGGGSAAQSVSPTLRALVDSLDPNPAHVINASWDLLAWNRGYARLVGGVEDVADEERNTLWLLFTRPAMRSLLVDWQHETLALVGQLRAMAGTHPDDVRITSLVAALLDASPAFEAMWSAHVVKAFAPSTKRFDHPDVGRLDLDYTKLAPVDDGGQHLLVFLPSTPEDAEALTRLTGRG